MSYPWQNLSPKDSFIIRQNSHITDVDRKVVTFLYQPIIGSLAYSLYMTMLSEVEEPGYESPVLLHAELFSVLSIGVQDFYQARIRLEGIGLLKTYRKNGSEKEYMYEPCPPVSSSHFFEDDLLRLLLLQKVGERKLASLRERFSIRKIEKDQWEDTTKSFLSVYDFSETAYQEQGKASFSKDSDKEKQLIQSRTGSPPLFKPAGFNYSYLAQLMQKEFFAVDVLTKDLKQTIGVLHTLYGLDEIEMSQLLLQAADLETGKVDPKALEEAVADFSSKSGTGSRAIKDKVETEIEKTKEAEDTRRKALEQAGYTAQEIQLIQMSERMTPFAFIQNIKRKKKGAVTANEKKLLQVLLEEHKLPPAVLNMLIYYMLVVQNNPTMNKGLAETIANHWSQDHVYLPEQAMEVSKQFVGGKIAQAEKRQERRTTAKYYGKNVVRKVEKLPEWATGDQPATTEELLPEDVQRKLNERLRKFREAGKAGEK